MMKNGNLINTLDGYKHTSKSPWWKWKQHTILSTLVIGLLILSAVFFYLLFSVEIEVCTKPSCVQASMELQKYMNLKVDPCEDFYRFSCGNFLENTNVGNRGSRSAQDIAEDEIQSEIRNMLEEPIQADDSRAFNLARTFYRTCMNETVIETEGLGKIKQMFRQIGGWPTLAGYNWRESEFDWKEALYKLRRMGANFDFFFTLSVDIDKNDPSRYILGIHNMPYDPSDISTSAKKMYLDYMKDIQFIFGAKGTMVEDDSNDVISLLLELAQIYKNIKSIHNGTDTREVLSLSELNYRYPSIPWPEYINEFVSPVESFTYDDMVMVHDPVGLKALENILLKTPKRTLANFIVWHTLQYIIYYLPEVIADRAYEYLGKVNGKITRKPRWKTCVEAVQQSMTPVISLAYIKQSFNEEIRSDINELISRIKFQFKRNIMTNLYWMDYETKQMVLEKLFDSSEDVVSYTDFMELVEESGVYDQVNVSEYNILESLLNLDFVTLNLKYGTLRKPVRHNWLKKIDFITRLDIHYSPKQNILRFPIGIFRGIYYQHDRPKYMNYGVLGSIFAHEVSHIFVQAEHSNSPGGLRSRWSTNSVGNYGEQLQCLSDQYGNFVVADLNKHLNPLKTQDEDMADLAGMKVSYDTYINWVQENGAEPRLPGLNYSANQLFWISSAIHHCSKYSTQTLERYIANYQWSPPEFRVNGPLRNLAEFAFDFGCPIGSKMNPEQKCYIW